MIQGELVNGSVGQVIDFSSSKDAIKNNTEVMNVQSAGEKLLADRGLPDNGIWPVVRFTNGRTLLCVAADFTVNSANGEMEALRQQVKSFIIVVSISETWTDTLVRFL